MLSFHNCFVVLNCLFLWPNTKLQKIAEHIIKILVNLSADQEILENLAKDEKFLEAIFARIVV